MNLHSAIAFRPASRLRIPPESQRPLALRSPPPKGTAIREVALYAGGVILSLAILILSLQLWRADLSVPFNYTPNGQDSFINMMLVKTVMETGWTAHNPLLGAPGMLDQLDFPNPESLHTAAIHAMSWVTSDFGVALNVYFLLTFPLTALTTTLCARQIGLGRSASLLVAQLYTFLPFHFMRGEIHLALAAYYAIPLVIPSILAVAEGEKISGVKAATAIAGFFLVGLSGPYYAAFALFFLGVSAVAAMVRRHDRQMIRLPMTLAVILIVTFIAQIVPNLMHTARFGPNPLAGSRVLYEGDLYGLHLTQMLLPVPGHRIGALAEFRDQYAAHAPMVNENESAALGIIGAWGILILLFNGVFSGVLGSASAGVTGVRGKLGPLAMLTLAGVLLATVGGIGPTLSYLGFTTIRGYNRISIFLALFALLAIGSLVDDLIKRRPDHRRKFGWILCAVVVLIGLFDQISPRFVPHYQQNARDFHSDADFVASIESSLPDGASIFQLPVVSYPESPPINALGDYELFRGYLHSSTLHWSYGAMKGREVIAWQKKLTTMPTQGMLDAIQSAGFAGIYLDRAAFLDNTLENAIKLRLGGPVVSQNGRLAFFRFNQNPGKQSKSKG